jgi:hypothetical protein
MKFIYFDEGACSEIISERVFQSPEFESGRLLVSVLRGAAPKVELTFRCTVHTAPEGVYVLTPSNDIQNYIVIDLEEASGLLRLDDGALILALQKTFRFANKHWAGLKPSANERVLSHNKVVIFPYPIGMHTLLRATLDRNPDEKRRAKREPQKALLFYKFADNEGAGVTEIPRLTNFRKAVEGREDAYALALQQLPEVAPSRNVSSALAVTELRDVSRPHVVEAGLEGWSKVLTSSQLAFVNSPLTVPHRIEGPAGTGKTLCLVLKALKTVEAAVVAAIPHRALFISHSEPTRRAIENLVVMNGGEGFLEAEVELLAKPQSVKITTLQELCANLLKRDLSESELVDRDAYESKLVQRLYATEGVERALRDEFESHAPFLSESFKSFLSETEHWAIAEMLQHEISVQIKGRADQELGKYKELERLKIGLPVESDGDKTFAFLMYQKYQEELETSAQFDTDDVVLSATSQLNTPIWRRRRAREGFNSVFIDETHLFNVNELSVFHRLTKSELSQPIAYSVDRSQALGDRGWTDLAFEAAFDPSGTLGQSDPTRIRSVFRCSPDIVDLAFSVTSSGATLFTNFHNPLTASVSAFTAEEERKSRKPLYLDFPTDEAMLEASFVRADSIAREMGVLKADVAIIVFGDDLFARAQELAKNGRKPVELVRSRGDMEAVNRAKNSGRFVLSAPEFVGGLEFAGVVLVGVDGGRVPPKGAGLDFASSQNFLNYSAHQRLYVAITRARFRVEILGNKARGVSDILRSAIAAKLLDDGEQGT